MADSISVAMTVNGVERAASVEPRKILADYLREDCVTTGVHLGCEQGACGSCTVLLDGEAVRSCLLFAVQAAGAAIVTAEGLVGADGTLSAVQEAFRECHGLQCGFCTPGFVVSATAYLATQSWPPHLDEIRTAMSGNLCRCTGYQGIVAAVHQASVTLAAGVDAEPAP